MERKVEGLERRMEEGFRRMEQGLWQILDEIRGQGRMEETQSEEDGEGEMEV